VPGVGGQSSIARLAVPFNHLGTLLKSASLSGPSLPAFHASPTSAAVLASPDPAAGPSGSGSAATLSRIAALASGSESAPAFVAGGASAAVVDGQTHDIRVCLYCLERSDVPIQERYTPMARKALLPQRYVAYSATEDPRRDLTAEHLCGNLLAGRDWVCRPMPTLTVLPAKKLRDLRDDQAREPVLKRGYLRKQSEKLKVGGAPDRPIV